MTSISKIFPSQLSILCCSICVLVYNLFLSTHNMNMKTSSVMGAHDCCNGRHCKVHLHLNAIQDSHHRDTSVNALHASVVHASDSGQLQANPHVTDPWLSPGKPTRRAVTMMGSNDLVVGEDHMLGPSCQRYNWKTGRCGSMAFGSSPRTGKTDFKPPLSCGCIHLWKRLQEITSRKNQEWSP